MDETLATPHAAALAYGHASTESSHTHAVARDHNALSQTAHEDISTDSLLKSLKDISGTLKASKHSTKALAGAMVGLRGSPAHERLVNDGLSAVNSLKNAIDKISKAEKIVEETLSSKTAVKSSNIPNGVIHSSVFIREDRNLHYRQFI
jgi:hypothetical protein